MDPVQYKDLIGCYFFRTKGPKDPPEVLFVSGINKKGRLTIEIVPLWIAYEGYTIPGGDYRCAIAVIDQSAPRTKSKMTYKPVYSLFGGKIELNRGGNWSNWKMCEDGESQVFKFLPKEFEQGVKR
jgi:hypothetical protein